MRLFSFSMILILSILALGAYTPLFGLLYGFVPGFNALRANAKIIFLVAMFAVMLSGVGLDDLLNNPRFRRRLSLIVRHHRIAGRGRRLVDSDFGSLRQRRGVGTGHVGNRRH